MNKKEISNELLLNTTDSYLKELINTSLLHAEKNQTNHDDIYLKHIDCCISIIENAGGFKKSGWRVSELLIDVLDFTPTLYRYFFSNDQTGQHFTFVVDSEKVSIGNETNLNESPFIKI